MGRTHIWVKCRERRRRTEGKKKTRVVETFLDQNDFSVRYPQRFKLHALLIKLYGLIWIIRGDYLNFLVISFVYMLQHITTEMLSEEKRLTLYKVAYVIGGASVGISIVLFGVGAVLKALSLPPLPHIIGTWPTVILLLIIAPSIGGYLGYRIGRREISNR